MERFGAQEARFRRSGNPTLPAPNSPFTFRVGLSGLSTPRSLHSFLHLHDMLISDWPGPVSAPVTDAASVFGCTSANEPDVLARSVIYG